MKKTGRKKNGATLIEVMLAMLILVVLAVAAFMGLSYPRSLVVTSTHKQAALHMANAAMEEVLALGYGSTNLVVGETVPISSFVSSSVNGVSMSGTRRIEAWDSEEFPMLLVTVTVDYLGADEPIVLETLLSPGAGQ